MNRIIINLFGIGMGLALLVGCGKESAKTPAVNEHVFDNAPPEIKQTWDSAVAATANNDEVAAITILRGLSRQPIDQEKQKTLFGLIVQNEDKLRAKAKAGDAEAQKAMQEFGISAEK